MNSLYFWSEEGPPTDWFNVWFYTGDRRLQQRIVDAVNGQPRSRFCVVDNAEGLSTWKGLVVPQLPLVRFEESLRREHGPFEVIGGPDGFQLFVSHGAQR
jgi:hypothetical protein